MSLGLIIGDIVGTPYRFPPDPPRSFDCWTLLVHIRRRMGLPTKVDIDPQHYDLTTMGDAVARECAGKYWHKVEGEPKDGDAVLFTPDHIGVSVGCGVLHAHAPSRTVMFTRWPVVLRRWTQTEVWRS